MTTPTVARPNQSARGPQWLRSCRWMLTATLYMMLWGWAIAIVLVTAILWIVSRYTGIEISGFAFSHQGMLWYPFSISIAFALMYLPLHVSSGMTRKSLIKSLIVSNTLIGLANAAFSMVALFVERAIYNQLGWFHGHTDGKGTDLFEHGAGVYALGLVLIFVGGMLSGALVAVTFYRFGGWATFLLPLTLIPIFGTAILGLNESSQWTPWETEFLGDWQGAVVLGILVLLAAAAALALLIRRIPIDTRRA